MKVSDESCIPRIADSKILYTLVISELSSRSFRFFFGLSSGFTISLFGQLSLVYMKFVVSF